MPITAIVRSARVVGQCDGCIDGMERSAPTMRGHYRAYAIHAAWWWPTGAPKVPSAVEEKHV